MITRNDVIDALTKCSGYASDRTPVPSEIVVAAWVEHFAQYPNLSRADLLSAVREHFNSPHDRMVQPQDLSWLARVAEAEIYERRPLPGLDRPTATEEHRRRCMNQITETLGKRWVVPDE